MHLQPLAIDGVFRATPGHAGARTFDWFRADTMARALPAGWQPSVGSVHTALAGHVAGLHCETSHRIVTCVSGRLALVVLDVRPGSTTFGRWIPIDLDTIKPVSVIIPGHTAWGFQAFTEGASLLSLHRGTPDGLVIHPEDVQLAIDWPLTVKGAHGETLTDVMPRLRRDRCGIADP